MGKTSHIEPMMILETPMQLKVTQLVQVGNSGLGFGV